jgi:hypothetical protein
MGAALGGGITPGLNVGASLGVVAFGGPLPRGRRRGWSWRAEAGWLHWFPRRKQFEDFDAITGEFSLTGGFMRGGPVFVAGPIELPILAGVELGSFTARTQTVGFPDVEGRSRLWSAATIGPAIAWEPAAPLGLWLGTDLAIPLTPHSFEVIGLGILHEVWPVSVRALGGLEIRFP